MIELAAIAIEESEECSLATEMRENGEYVADDYNSEGHYYMFVVRELITWDEEGKPEYDYWYLDFHMNEDGSLEFYRQCLIDVDDPFYESIVESYEEEEDER